MQYDGGRQKHHSYDQTHIVPLMSIHVYGTTLNVTRYVRLAMIRTPATVAILSSVFGMCLEIDRMTTM